MTDNITMAINNNYPENVKKIATELINIIEKYYPDITKKTFNNFGYPDRNGSPALERAEMCIYIELLKAGVKFNE